MLKVTEAHTYNKFIEVTQKKRGRMLYSFSFVCDIEELGLTKYFRGSFLQKEIIAYIMFLVDIGSYLVQV
jgi:hypothetical protein